MRRDKKYNKRRREGSIWIWILDLDLDLSLLLGLDDLLGGQHVLLVCLGVL